MADQTIDQTIDKRFEDRYGVEEDGNDGLPVHGNGIEVETRVPHPSLPGSLGSSNIYSSDTGNTSRVADTVHKDTTIPLDTSPILDEGTSPHPPHTQLHLSNAGFDTLRHEYTNNRPPFLFGTNPNATPKAPLPDEFCFEPTDIGNDSAGLFDKLPAKVLRNLPATPASDEYFPLAPKAGYSLVKTHCYQRGFIYLADHSISEGSKNELVDNLQKIATPPNVTPDFVNGAFIAKPIPGMVQMVPGVPYVFALNGDHNRLHTVGCVHTLESLKAYPDHPQIVEDSIKLARLTWGVKNPDGSWEIPPVFEMAGLKVNDRSAKRKDFHKHTNDGSFNLASTVMKGDGPGTFLPATQVDTPEAKLKISEILKTLYSLFSHIMPKSLSKFECEMMKFHQVFNNVFSCGGLGFGSTSVQMNASALGKTLAYYIGIKQGWWHKDKHDDPRFRTLFVLLLRLGSKGDPGPFCLARAGIYVRELDVWIVFITMNGTDVHAGFAPSEDPKEHENWINTSLQSAWNLAGPQNRVGYVCYTGEMPSQRAFGSMNISPPTMFGNFGFSKAHKEKQLNFAQHGTHILGGQDAHANRLAREAVYNFWNQLQYSKLSLNMDLNKLMELLSYKDATTGKNISLMPLPLRPKEDDEHIQHMQSLYAWYNHESNLFRLRDFKIRKKLSTSVVEQETEPLQQLLINQAPMVFDTNKPQASNSSPDTSTAVEEHSQSSTNNVVNQLQNDELTNEVLSPDSVLNADPDNNSSSNDDAQQVAPSPMKKHPRRKRQNEDTDMGDEIEEIYEVESIQGHKQDLDGNWLWKVVWKGYNGEEAWMKETELGGCIELLAEYNRAHNISLKDVFGPGLVEFQFDSTQTHLRRGKKPRQSTTVIMADKINILSDLFSESTLSTEVSQLQAYHDAPRKSSYYQSKSKGTKAVNPLYHLWKNQQEKNHCLTNHIAALPNASLLAAHLEFQRVQNAVDFVEAVDQELEKMAVITRAVRYKKCLSLIQIFEWHYSIGPRIIRRLTALHKESPEQLLESSPQLGKLISHIVEFLRHSQTVKSLENKKNKPTKKTKKQSQTAQPKAQLLEETHKLIKAQENLEKYSKIPTDLFGLRGPKTNSVIKLPAVRKGISYDLYDLAPVYVMEFITQEIIVPKLRKIDQTIVMDKAISDKDNLILERAITRGAILWVITQACKAPGILAASAMDSFLKSPALIFQEPHNSTRNFESLILREREGCLKPLADWVQETVSNSPMIVTYAHQIEWFTKHQMLELCEGHSIPLDISGEDVELQPLTKSLPQKASGNRRNNLMSTNGVNIQLTADSLAGENLSLAMIGLILREALNRKRYLPPGDDILHRVLNGKHSLTSTIQSHNPDHTNPIREEMSAAQLLFKHIPPSKITSKLGISNLLSWLGTGQGWRTKTFLQTLEIDGGFWSNSLRDMIQKFQNQMSINAILMNQASQFGKTDLDTLNGYVRVDDPRIWGQPCAFIAATPYKAERKMTLSEKFSPYWLETVQNAWAHMLGKMLDQDPSTFTGKKLEWSSIETIIDLVNAPPFKSGLSRLQVINYLVSLKVVEPPQPVEMAIWIHQHRNLGAIRGLEDLGFELITQDVNYTKAAFLCVYHHLDKYLSDEDKNILFFGTIFVEHLLCKVSRWNTRLKTEHSEKESFFFNLAESVKDTPFTTGQNLTSHEAFPIPLCVEKECINKIINSIIKK